MKSKFLAAAVLAATALSLPALADGPDRSRPAYGGQPHERRDDHRAHDRGSDRRGHDQRSDWRGHDQRHDSRNYRGGDWRNGRHYDNRRHNYRHDDNRYGHGNSWRDDRHRYYGYGRYPYRGSRHYSPGWYGGYGWSHGYRGGGRGYGHGYGYSDRYDDRCEDYWDGYRWHRTYRDDAGFFFYYDGDIVIRLGGW